MLFHDVCYSGVCSASYFPKLISHNFIKIDKFNHSGIQWSLLLSILPKVKYEHIAPTSFSKMRVNLAAQVRCYWTLTWTFPSNHLLRSRCYCGESLLATGWPNPDAWSFQQGIFGMATDVMALGTLRSGWIVYWQKDQANRGAAEPESEPETFLDESGDSQLLERSHEANWGASHAFIMHSSLCPAPQGTTDIWLWGIC